MDSEKVIKRDNEYVLHTYNRNPIVLEKGHGLRAAGPEGQQYLDFTVIWIVPRPFPISPTSCSIPLTFTTPRSAASWPKSCASAPA